MSAQTSLVVEASAAEAVRLPTRRRARFGRGAAWAGWLFALPALGFYAFFNLQAILLSVQYSFYDWDGIGASTFVGLQNYIEVFTDPTLLYPLFNAFFLIIFFTIIPLTFALIAASTMRTIENKFAGGLARTMLFLPQIIPGAAAAVAWTWMYSTNGLVNQVLTAVGLGSLTRAWLGDFTFALGAVGFIGTWLSTGFCTLLLLSGIGKIDPSLYEAARLDGAGPVAQFFSVTLPGLRQEIGVAVTVTIISALASFDVVYLSTQGGPAGRTQVPGVQVYLLAFNDARLGAASALAIVLAILIIIVIVPLQRLFRER